MVVGDVAFAARQEWTIGHPVAAAFYTSTQGR